MKNPVSYKMLSPSELELNIAGVIGDGWDDNPVTAKAVRRVLDSNKKVSLIRVNVDSSGGSFFDGLAIYQMLLEHQADVEVYVGARAASAASLIAMAGDKRSLHETSTFLVHPVWTVAIGNADELRKAASDLDTLTESSVTAYAAATGKTPEEVRALMAEDRFMSATEAFEFGFCTEIRKAPKKNDSTESSMSESEVRSEIESMRSKATASAAALRVAAMAPPAPTPEPVAPEQTIKTPPASPAVMENTKNMAQLAVILAALGIAEGASDTDALSVVNNLKTSAESNGKLLSLVGAKSTDEAIGIVAALQANKDQADGEGHSRILALLGVAGSDEAVGKIAALTVAQQQLEAVRAELTEINRKSEETERQEIIERLRSEHKLSPDQETNLLPKLNMTSLKAFAATAVPFLAGDGFREPSAKGPYKGKSYAEMTNMERHELANSDPELFKQLSEQYTI